jgi:hypothetical protein
MTTHGHIVIREGRAYVRVTVALSTAPALFSTFWLLSLDPSIVEAEAPASSSIGDAAWRVSRYPFDPVYARTLNPDGSIPDHPGSAVAAFTEETPIPAPRVRKGTPVRWSFDGFWEKYSARQGWIPARA